jgi:hypothetical protein
MVSLFYKELWVCQKLYLYISCGEGLGPGAWGPVVALTKKGFLLDGQNPFYKGHCICSGTIVKRFRPLKYSHPVENEAGIPSEFGRFAHDRKGFDVFALPLV